MIVRVVCGVLAAAIILGVVAHPPANFTQGMGMLFPVAMLLGFAIRGGPRKRFGQKPPEKVPPP